jgi:hypothetical protein
MAGHVRVKWHGARVNTARRRGQREGLEDAAGHVKRVSQERHVPLEDLHLRASARSGALSDRRAFVSYGDPGVEQTAQYAVRRHEELDVRFEPGSPRGAKYLERPLFGQASEVWRIIGRSIRRYL